VQNSRCQQSLAIFKRLADQDKSNSGWQRDLIVSLYKVGLVRAEIKGSDNIKQAQGLLRTGLKTAELYPGGSMLARSYRDFSGSDPQAVKTIVQRESRHGMHSMNRCPPFRPDRGLLFRRDP
jgi:hypothetical protein